MWQDIRFSARDGTLLYARRYPAPAARRALICLPGLVGNSAEFHTLAMAISGDHAESRQVFAVDYRGRGRSGFSSKRQGPAMLTECEDILDFMTLAGLDDVALLGTGHGGQLTMIAGLLRPHAAGLVIFNDSAPEFEIEGVVRLLGEVANMPLPPTWPDAAAMLKSQHGRRYPKVPNEQWLEIAKGYYPEANGRPLQPFDPAIAASYSLSRGTLSRQTLWPQFAAITRAPALLLRAEFSDMVSAATAARMREMHPLLETVQIPREGHPALLRDAASIAIIASFLSRNERLEAGARPALLAVA